MAASTSGEHRSSGGFWLSRSGLPGLLADAALFLVIFGALVPFTDNLFVDNHSTPLICGLLGAASGTILQEGV
jgi:hypothetical protein